MHLGYHTIEHPGCQVFFLYTFVLLTFRLKLLQPAFNQAPGIVHTASADGKSFFYNRSLCGLADVVFGMGQSTAFMGAEGINGLP